MVLIYHKPATTDHVFTTLYQHFTLNLNSYVIISHLYYVNIYSIVIHIE
jgi:hypothetical protein